MADPIRASDYHDIAKPSDPRLSPDGTEIAFVRSVPEDDDSYEATVYLVPTDGSADPRRFTVAEGNDATPRWSPSGDRLAFTSTRGAEDDRQQLWVIPRHGGEARQVTDVAGGVSSITWSPDGSRIAFVQSVTSEDREEDRDLTVPEEYDPDDPDPRVIDRTVYRSMQRYFDGERSQVYIVDLDGTGVADADAFTRVTTAEYDHSSPEWGDESTLYYTVKSLGEDPDDSYEYEIRAYDTQTETDEAVHQSTGWGASLAVTPDDRIAYLYTDPDQASIQQTELHVYDRSGDDVHEVTADFDRTLGYEAAPQWGPQDERLYFTTPDEGVTALWSAPGDASETPVREYRGGAVNGADIDSETVVVTRSEWDHPGDVFAIDRSDEERDASNGRSGTRLSTLNAEYLESNAVQEPESIEFASDQGPVEGWVLTPPDFDADEKYPMIVEVHGGPHAMWTTAGTMWHEFQTLAARGYVVFWCNPRGSTGFGEEFMQAIERDWGSVTLTDVMAGVETVAAREYVDESNVFLTGGSFGGYMTSWTVGQTDYFEGAVSQRGVYDLTGFYGSTDGAYKLVEGDYDTTPWEEPEFLWEQSPVGHANEVDTPTLVIHSERDYRTPTNTAELFHRILRKHGVDTRLVRYPREGHELSRSGEPAHVVDRIERIARWFDGYSEHHEAPRALDRDENEGLSAGDEEDETTDEE